MISLFYKIPVASSRSALFQTLRDKVEHPEKYVSGVTEVDFVELDDGRRLRKMMRNDIVVQEVIDVSEGEGRTTFELKDHPKYEGTIENGISEENGTVFLTYALQWEAHTGRDDFETVKSWMDKAVADTVSAAEQATGH